MKSAVRTIFCWVLCWWAAVSPQTAQGQLRLPRLIGDGMVLQRGAAVNIWGWDTAGRMVTVTLDGRHRAASADAEGRWSVVFDDLAPGGPHTMDIHGSRRVVINDIVVGDVWLCSGQSNMELSMERVQERYADVIARAAHPAIRHFKVPRHYDFKSPRDDLTDGQWVSATPETVLEFTAAGYFFAEALYERYGVPIGLINAALGGAPAEAWLSAESLKAFPDHRETAMRFADDAYIARIEQDDHDRQAAWYARLQRLDAGIEDGRMPFLEADCDISAWPQMEIPGYWDEGPPGAANGVVWFRRTFDVPSEVAGRAARLRLGCIVDSDQAYVNGTLVGTTGYQYPPRRYAIPEGLLKGGRNTIVVRVINTIGRGGFVPDKPYDIIIDDTTINLRGTWNCRLGAAMEPLPPPVFVQWQPMGLYNAMIAPLNRYAITGVIWYQGESNVGRADEYRTLFPAVIADWRKHRDQGDFPFLYVQLANFLQTQPQPSESAWAQLREAQRQTLAVRRTAMAVTIDIGEWNDIHPLNKADVGRRLALAARKVAYGEAIVYSGPLFESMRIDGDTAIVSFQQVGDGLVAKGNDTLRGFAVAGSDGCFVWADAAIEGDTVVVRSAAVARPAAVRYAWADNPDDANLYNKQGLPASPFQASP